MPYLLFIAALLAAVYFCIRFYLLKKALREGERELREIQRDLTQNQVLHLPLPDKDLEIFMGTINGTLDKIGDERRKYQEREREFQAQIEAVSHDLRTPLTVILGYLNIFMKKGNFFSDTEEQKEMLNIVIRKARTMENLITQFYDYSRLNASDYELNLGEIDASKILLETFADNCLLLEKANLQVETNFLNHPVWVKGEKGAFERILTNLLQNAGRYAKSFLRLAILEEGEFIQITFENDTSKIDEKDIPYLFDRFYMNNSSRNQGGSGLGLTIAKSLAEAMGGKLEVCIVNEYSLSEKNMNQGELCIRFKLCMEALPPH